MPIPSVAKDKRAKDNTVCGNNMWDTGERHPFVAVPERNGELSMQPTAARCGSERLRPMETRLGLKWKDEPATPPLVQKLHIRHLKWCKRNQGGLSSRTGIFLRNIGWIFPNGKKLSKEKTEPATPLTQAQPGWTFLLNFFPFLWARRPFVTVELRRRPPIKSYRPTPLNDVAHGGRHDGNIGALGIGGHPEQL